MKNAIMYWYWRPRILRYLNENALRPDIPDDVRREHEEAYSDLLKGRPTMALFQLQADRAALNVRNCLDITLGTKGPEPDETRMQIRRLDQMIRALKPS